METITHERQIPRVSVIMPSYNAERFIEEAIRSVKDQSMTDWELLVIDDCSTDNTVRIIQKLADEDNRIIFLRNPQNLGVSKTRNRGIDLAKGRFIAFLDCDDVWHSEKLEKQLQRMAQTGADLCYSAYAIVDECGKKIKNDYLVPEQADISCLLKENVIGCSTALVRRETLNTHHFGSAYYHEDYVLWLTLLQEGCLAYGCTEVLTDWRLIANSRSFNKIRGAMYRWKIYRDFLQLPMGKSLHAFACYATASLHKYL